MCLEIEGGGLLVRSPGLVSQDTLAELGAKIGVVCMAHLSTPSVANYLPPSFLSLFYFSPFHPLSAFQGHYLSCTSTCHFLLHSTHALTPSSRCMIIFPFFLTFLVSLVCRHLRLVVYQILILLNLVAFILQLSFDDDTHELRNQHTNVCWTAICHFVYLHFILPYSETIEVDLYFLYLFLFVYILFLFYVFFLPCMSRPQTFRPTFFCRIRANDDF